jgi:inorganic pyrophosphatase
MIPVEAPRLEAVRTVFTLPKRLRDELECFFATAVAFEKKNLRILGWAGPNEAKALIRTSRRKS